MNAKTVNLYGSTNPQEAERKLTHTTQEHDTMSINADGPAHTDAAACKAAAYNCRRTPNKTRGTQP